MLNQIKTVVSGLFGRLYVRVFAGLVIFYFLFGYFAVNPLAQRILPWVVENKLASRASVGRVAFDPLRLKVTIDEFRLTQKSGAPLASFDKLVVDLEASGLFDWAWKFKEISLIAPSANIAIAADGKFNWAELIAKLNEDKTPPSDTIPRVVMGHIAIIHGQVEYVDAHRAAAFQSSISPVDLELDGFSTLPKDRGEYLLAAKLPEQGGVIKWKGDMGVNPVASKGAIALEGLNLAKLKPLLANASSSFVPENGELQLGFHYDFSLLADKPKVALSQFAFKLNHLSAGLGHGRKLALTEAAITAPRVDFAMQNQPQLDVQNLTLALDDVNVQLGRDSRISLKNTTATLPQLHVAIKDTPQAQFDDLNIKLRALQIAQGHESLLDVPELEVKQIAFNLAERSVQVAQVLLANGALNATLDKTGAVNWQQAFASDADKSASAEPASAASVADAPSKPFSLDIADVQLQHWRGKWQQQNLAHPLQLSFADFNLGFALTSAQDNLAIHRLSSTISDFAVQSSLFKTPVASLAKFSLDQGEVDITKQKVQLQSLSLSGLKSEIIKSANSPLNWQAILEPLPTTGKAASVPTSAPASSKSSAPNWSVMLNKLAVDNASLHVEDRSQAIPVVLDIEKALLEVRTPSLDLAKPLPIKAAFQVKQGGQFSLQGKLTPAPLKSDLNFKLSDFTLLPFSAYINQFALLKLASGTADVAGNVAIKQAKDLAVVFKGGFSVNKLALVAEDSAVPFLAWERVGSDSLEFDLAPNQLHIHEDKSLNVTRILRNQPAPAAPVVAAANSGTSAKPQAAPKANAVAASTNSAPDAFPVSIDTVRIDNAELDFADLSLTPQFGTHINSLSGVVNGVSTLASSVAQVEMDGKVDEYGSASIRGSLQPFNATQFTDLKLAFKNLEMNRLTPYSGKFAGRRIDSGRLSVDLQYKIKQRQLAGENKFVINKLKLGEKVDSKEAADLPLDLAIAILEDSDGVIDLDLPISGSLDDPQFSYGSIVWKAIKNVLSKIVTAPFHALGKLFGGSGDKLDGISFDAGSSQIAPPEQEKLSAISQMLSKRAGLALSITPSYQAASDTRAVQEQTLRKQVAQAMGIKLAEGQQAGPIDLTNPKTQKVLDDMYDTLTQKGLLKKLTAKFENPPAGHYEEAQEKLTASIAVSDADLQTLAKSRGEAIQKYLLNTGITPERVRVDNPSKSDSKAISAKLAMEVKGGKS
jgi:Domain of Unknown Function (DUF748)